MDAAVGQVKIDSAGGVVGKDYITDSALNDRGFNRWREVTCHASNLAFI
jgi:hypothetical protein